MSDLSMKQHSTIPALDLPLKESESRNAPSENEIRLGKRVVELEDERDALLVSCYVPSQLSVDDRPRSKPLDHKYQHQPLFPSPPLLHHKLARQSLYPTSSCLLSMSCGTTSPSSRTTIKLCGTPFSNKVWHRHRVPAPRQGISRLEHSMEVLPPLLICKLW